MHTTLTEDWCKFALSEGACRTSAGPAGCRVPPQGAIPWPGDVKDMLPRAPRSLEHLGTPGRREQSSENTHHPRQKSRRCSSCYRRQPDIHVLPRQSASVPHRSWAGWPTFRRLPRAADREQYPVWRHHRNLSEGRGHRQRWRSRQSPGATRTRSPDGPRTAGRPSRTTQFGNWLRRPEDTGPRDPQGDPHRGGRQNLLRGDRRLHRRRFLGSWKRAWSEGRQEARGQTQVDNLQQAPPPAGTETAPEQSRPSRPRAQSKAAADRRGGHQFRGQGLSWPSYFCHTCSQAHALIPLAGALLPRRQSGVMVRTGRLASRGLLQGFWG